MTPLAPNQVSLLSQQALENGYQAWLVEQLRRQAHLKFASASPDDTQALMRARVAFDMAAEVGNLIKDAAK